MSAFHLMNPFVFIVTPARASAHCSENRSNTRDLDQGVGRQQLIAGKQYMAVVTGGAKGKRGGQGTGGRHLLVPCDDGRQSALG